MTTDGDGTEDIYAGRRKVRPREPWPGFQPSGEFVADYRPPSYLIVPLLQRRSLYALTGPTGSGKTAVGLRIAAHVQLGQELAGMTVKQGRVLYLAGENPDDVRTRWIKQCEEMGV